MANHRGAGQSRGLPDENSLKIKKGSTLSRSVAMKLVGLNDRISYRTLQWLVAVFALLHNLEEALTMGRYAPLVRDRLSGVVPPGLLTATEHLSWFYSALIVASIVPVLLVIGAVTHPTNRVAARTVLVVQSLFLVNVFVPHVPAAVALGGYAPGVVTALALELPFSVYFLRRSVRDGVVSGMGALLTVALAGPGLLLVLGTLYSLAR
jgi:hypothetical protein